MNASWTVRPARMDTAAGTVPAVRIDDADGNQIRIMTIEHTRRLIADLEKAAGLSYWGSRIRKVAGR